MAQAWTITFVLKNGEKLTYEDVVMLQADPRYPKKIALYRGDQFITAIDEDSIQEVIEADRDENSGNGKEILS
jgi:hypothetical protein